MPDVFEPLQRHLGALKYRYIFVGHGLFIFLNFFKILQAIRSPVLLHFVRFLEQAPGVKVMEAFVEIGAGHGEYFGRWRFTDASLTAWKLVKNIILTKDFFRSFNRNLQLPLPELSPRLGLGQNTLRRHTLPLMYGRRLQKSKISRFDKIHLFSYISLGINCLPLLKRFKIEVKTNPT
jgi:hypothetical protein